MLPEIQHKMITYIQCGEGKQYVKCKCKPNFSKSIKSTGQSYLTYLMNKLPFAPSLPCIGKSTAACIGPSLSATSFDHFLFHTTIFYFC